MVNGQTGLANGAGLNRREFIKAGAAGAGVLGAGLADPLFGQAVSRDLHCILLFLVGGPSQLDTWDLKPDAPAEVRGPFRPIATKVPGIQIGEHFPRMAALVDRFALIRSVHHGEAPIHETGHQLMQTGRLFRHGQEHPHYGAALSALRGRRAGALPPFAVIPRPIGSTGVSVSHGQGAGYLGAAHEPFGLEANEIELALAAEKETLRDRYGRNRFGQSCLLARRLIEQGTRLVTVNMFDTVFGETTWDCHADGGSLASTLDDYQRTLCPMFDLAYTALLEDLDQRGLLGSTLVVAMGEFGRTPRLNARGGRDHWPGVWSILFAGGSVRGGQVIGSSDRIGSEPRNRPVSPAEVAASVYHGLGLDPAARLPGPDGQPLPLVEANPVMELFS